MSEPKTLPRIPNRSVWELTKVSGDGERPLETLLEEAIEDMQGDGFELESWQFTSVYVPDSEVIVRTIVAVFVQRYVVE